MGSGYSFGALESFSSPRDLEIVWINPNKMRPTPRIEIMLKVGSPNDDTNTPMNIIAAPIMNHGMKPTINIAIDRVAAVFLLIASISSEFSLFVGTVPPSIVNNSDNSPI